MGFRGGSDGKESACNAGDPGSIPGWGRSSEKEMAAHSSVLPGKSHGQRSLVDYSPWGHEESDTTEWLTPFTFLLLHISAKKKNKPLKNKKLPFPKLVWISINLLANLLLCKTVTFVAQYLQTLTLLFSVNQNMYAQSLSHVWLFATPWTAACQAPLSMEFSRQEYWSGLPFPSPNQNSADKG